MSPALSSAITYSPHLIHSRVPNYPPQPPPLPPKHIILPLDASNAGSRVIHTFVVFFTRRVYWWLTILPSSSKKNVPRLWTECHVWKKQKELWDYSCTINVFCHTYYIWLIKFLQAYHVHQWVKRHTIFSCTHKTRLKKAGSATILPQKHKSVNYFNSSTI